MSHKSVHDYLKSVPWFADLNEKELAEVDRLVTPLDFPDGEKLMTEGAVANEMFIVKSGTLSISVDGEQITTLGEGAFVGELALLTHSHRSASVTAIGPVSVLHIAGTDFSSLLHEFPEIAVKMLPIVARRAQELGHAEDA